MKTNLNLLLALSTISLFLLVSCNESPKVVAPQTPVNTIKIISPPFDNINIQYANYEVDASKDTVVIHHSGSKLMIPKEAFLDANGEVVKGKVKVEYREFANAFDAYIGGIPMQYDSAETKMVFETAGMIEIKASSNGQAVYVNPKNKINVEMNSFQLGNQYNTYQLDTISGKWKLLGKDKVVQKDYKDEIAKLPKIPRKPKLASYYSFTIEDTFSRFPELAMYKNVMFESTNQNMGISCPKITIEEAEDGFYKLSFFISKNAKKPIKTLNCEVVFKKGSDYDNAIKVYQAKYEKLIAKRGKMKSIILQEWENYKQIEKWYFDNGLMNVFIETEIGYLESDLRLVRLLEINGFGLINCDNPIAYPSGADITANFIDEKGEKLTLTNLTLVEIGRNSIFQYPDSHIKFDPTKNNILWGITSNKEIAFLKAKDFNNITNYSGNVTIKMNIHKSEVKSFQDICNSLFI